MDKWLNLIFLSDIILQGRRISFHQMTFHSLKGSISFSPNDLLLFVDNLSYSVGTYFIFGLTLWTLVSLNSYTSRYIYTYFEPIPPLCTLGTSLVYCYYVAVFSTLQIVQSEAWPTCMITYPYSHMRHGLRVSNLY